MDNEGTRATSISDKVGGYEIVLVASGDMRQAANRICWPAQEEMESAVIEAFKALGVAVRRAHPYDPIQKHGFIHSQRMGMDVFQKIDAHIPVVVAEAVWQYSHHVLAGLRSHHGPILTMANWSGQWPGLVGLLNLNASLTKAGVPYSTIWSKDFTDFFFIDAIKQWLREGEIHHDVSHCRDLDPGVFPDGDRELGQELANRLQEQKAILGIFDEGCMGMYNAIIDDEMLNPMGIYKERLSQSALLAAMARVDDRDARSVRAWLDRRGMTFRTGSDPAADLTDDQIHEQCKMYIAALRIADAFRCDAIGIQYQQGLKDMAPASDLVEGLLNNRERPPVVHAETGEVLYANEPLPHFNEVDEGAAVDALVTNRVWGALDFDPATTLHDIRWGEQYRDEDIDEFVWVFQISGAAPPAHFIGGYRGAVSERQPPMYFPLGGGTLKGVCKPGELVWSRIYVMEGGLHADLGRAKVVELPQEETERRWRLTTKEWPIMHAVLHGVGRDQLMARHKSNHIQVAYAPDATGADRALRIKATMLDAMGIVVHLCGDEKAR